MNCLIWVEPALEKDENIHDAFTGTKLYDGEKKTEYENGHLTVTNFRLMWRNSNHRQSLAVNLPHISSVKQEEGGFFSSPKAVIFFNPCESPTSINANYIKISFKHGGLERCAGLINDLKNDLKQKKAAQPKKLRTGILGIERDIEEKQKQTDKNIGIAFEDMKNLMALAKDMVATSKNIANKLREHPSELNTDETTKLRSYLLSLGIDDPVTKETIGTSSDYYKELARELVKLLEPQVKDMGGTMLLSEAYCRINRARGMHLLSPDDILSACSCMPLLSLPLRLQVFKSGVQAISLSSLDENEIANLVENVLVEYDKTGVSVGEYSSITGISILLAQERLYIAENKGTALKDLSAEGLRYFPNLFWHKRDQ